MLYFFKMKTLELVKIEIELMYEKEELNFFCKN